MFSAPIARHSAGAAVLGLAAVLTACGVDKVSSPAAALADPVAAPTGEALPVSLVLDVVTRDVPLESDITVRATIGPEGGTLTIPNAGLTLVVPRGAVSKPVAFRATARRGAIIAYDFGPSGRFPASLSVTQDLANTSWERVADREDVAGGYFASESALDAHRRAAEVSELQPSTVDVGRSSVTFGVRHFSGYVIAVGSGRGRGRKE